MSRFVGVALSFVASAALVAGFQPPPPEGGGEKKGPPGKGQKGGKGMGKGKRGFQLGTVLPPHVVDELELTADQQKKLEALEKDVKAKLEKILTADQVKRIDEIGPPMGKDGPPGGKDGPPGGGKEAPMPKEKKGERPDRPGGGE